MTNFDTFITGATIPEDCGSYYRYSLYQDRRPDPERPGTVERVIVQRIVITKEDFHRMFLRRMEWMHGRRRDLS